MVQDAKAVTVVRQCTDSHNEPVILIEKKNIKGRRRAVQSGLSTLYYRPLRNNARLCFSRHGFEKPLDGLISSRPSREDFVLQRSSAPFTRISFLQEGIERDVDYGGFELLLSYCITRDGRLRSLFVNPRRSSKQYDVTVR